MKNLVSIRKKNVIDINKVIWAAQLHMHYYNDL